MSSGTDFRSGPGPFPAALAAFRPTGAARARGELASGVDPARAYCPDIRTTDPSGDLGRSRFVQAAGRRAVVLVRASALPQGTSVEVDLRTIGLYPHAFTGDTVEALCDSTGSLERRILDAAESPP